MVLEGPFAESDWLDISRLMSAIFLKYYLLIFIFIFTGLVNVTGLVTLAVSKLAQRKLDSVYWVQVCSESGG